jgi:hypothetical protein
MRRRKLAEAAEAAAVRQAPKAARKAAQRGEQPAVAGAEAVSAPVPTGASGTVEAAAADGSGGAALAEASLQEERALNGHAPTAEAGQASEPWRKFYEAVRQATERMRD